MNQVFQAVSDATRRDILDRLRTEGPLSLTDVAAPLTMTRQAVAKHLDVLQSAGLVTRRQRGRERIHEVRDEPLRSLSDWLAPWEAEWDARLARLKDHVDGKGEDDDGSSDE